MGEIDWLGWAGLGWAGLGAGWCALGGRATRWWKSFRAGVCRAEGESLRFWLNEIWMIRKIRSWI